MTKSGKIEWPGTLLAVQPRIRLMRSYDERGHTYQGYVLRVSSCIGGDEREFVVAIGKAAHAKHRMEGATLPVRCVTSPDLT